VNPSDERCECKVGRVIEKFDLDSIDDELVARRRGESGKSASLRDLTDYFNQQVVRSALERAGEPPLDGEGENMYRLLTDDEVSRGMQIRVRKQLEREDVDIEAIEDGFVSHPTIGKHLKTCLGVERTQDPVDRVQTARERVFKIQNRAEAVIENTLSWLASAGLLASGDLSVSVDAQVVCEECGSYGEVGQFIERGGCDCEHDRE
jgi:hypothetical protein